MRHQTKPSLASGPIRVCHRSLQHSWECLTLFCLFLLFLFLPAHAQETSAVWDDPLLPSSRAASAFLPCAVHCASAPMSCPRHLIFSRCLSILHSIFSIRRALRRFLCPVVLVPCPVSQDTVSDCAYQCSLPNMRLVASWPSPGCSHRVTACCVMPNSLKAASTFARRPSQRCP